MPLTKNMSSGKVVDDIVHSKNKMFAHDSKKQRIRRALGAYYSMHKEEIVSVKHKGLSPLQKRVKIWAEKKEKNKPKKEKSVNELYGKGQTEKIAAHHLTKIMAKGAEGKPETEVHRAKFQRAIGVGVKQIYAKRAKLRKQYEETEVNELSKETLRSYFNKAGKERKQGKEKADLRLAGTMNTKKGSQSYHPEEVNRSVEAIRELHQSTLKSYVKKAAGDVRDTAYMAGMRDAANPNHARYWNKSERRVAGIHRAIKKIK